MKLVYNNKTEEHNIALHQHSPAFNIGTINSATSIRVLGNPASNGRTLIWRSVNIKIVKQ